MYYRYMCLGYELGGLKMFLMFTAKNPREKMIHLSCMHQDP